MKLDNMTAYGAILEIIVNKRSEALLDEIQVYYPNIFKEPKYPTIQKRVSFSISLVDENLSPPKHKLYPLSEPESQELHEQQKSISR